MTKAALNRKMQQLRGVGVLGPAGSQMMQNPRAFIEDQQDRDRTYLAAELLKIATEVRYGTPDLPTGALVAWAAEAVAAAEIIFPELPDDEGSAA